jgi:hypothetical protein
MGYYTQLKCDVLLNDANTIQLINDLLTGDLMNDLFLARFGRMPSVYSVGDTPDLPISHIFGKSSRWPQMLHPNSCTITDNKLVIECDIKAYNDIYEHFVDWLKPFIITGTIEIKFEDQDDWITLLNIS